MWRTPGRRSTVATVQPTTITSNVRWRHHGRPECGELAVDLSSSAARLIVPERTGANRHDHTVPPGDVCGQSRRAGAVPAIWRERPSGAGGGLGQVSRRTTGPSRRTGSSCRPPGRGLSGVARRRRRQPRRMSTASTVAAAAGVGGVVVADSQFLTDMDLALLAHEASPEAPRCPPQQHWPGWRRSPGWWPRYRGGGGAHLRLSGGWRPATHGVDIGAFFSSWARSTRPGAVAQGAGHDLGGRALGDGRCGRVRGQHAGSTRPTARVVAVDRTILRTLTRLYGLRYPAAGAIRGPPPGHRPCRSGYGLRYAIARHHRVIGVNDSAVAGSEWFVGNA
jgi:hypothetical protein